MIGWTDSHLHQFTALTLEQLLGLPVGERAPFEPFADQFIAAAPLVWPSRNQDSARTSL